MDPEVVRGIVVSKRDNDQEYYALVQALSKDFENGDVQKMHEWIVIFQQISSSFTKDSSHIVDVLLQQDLWSLAQLREDFLNFLTILVSSCSLYAEACMAYLIGYLYRPLPHMENEVEREHLENLRKEVDTSVLSALHDILHCVPGQLPNFASVLRNQMPHFTQDLYIQEKFCFNIYDLTLEYPALTEEVLHLVIGQIIDMDLQYKAEEESRESSAEDDLGEDGQLDVYDDFDDLDDEDDEDHGASQQSKHIKKNKKVQNGTTSNNIISSSSSNKSQLFQKLDVLMKLTLGFVYTRLYDKEKGDPESTFALLMSVFEKKVLVAYRPAFVQYIWFYLGHFDEGRYAEKIVTTCFSHLGNQSCSEFVRQSAAAYVGGLIARADYLSLDLVASTIMACTEWAREYVREFDDDARVELKHHVPFYALCQSIFYMLCFRCEDFAHHEHGIPWMRSLKLEAIIRSPFNPLKYVSEDVVNIFAKSMNRYGILNCETDILKNKGASVSAANVASDGGVKYELLEDFFPFDPVQLPSVLETIDELYKKWQPVEGGDIEDMIEPQLSHESFSAEQNSTDNIDDFLAQSLGTSLTMNTSAESFQHGHSLMSSFIHDE